MTQKAEPTTKTGQALLEILPLLELTAINVHELKGRRLEPEEVSSNEEDTSELGLAELQVHATQDDERVLVRVQGTTRTESVEVEVCVVGRFDKAEPFEVGDAALAELIEKIGLMALFPYIRQTIHDLSSRLGSPATLNLLRAGQLQVGRDEDAD